LIFLGDCSGQTLAGMALVRARNLLIQEHHAAMTMVTALILVSVQAKGGERGPTLLDGG